MAKSPTWLLDFQQDAYSQTGEDGIIKKILDLLPSRDNWCVEFGAWDGKQLSTTCNLIENKRYSAVLIEGDRKKYEDLIKNHGGNSRVIAKNRYVGFGPDDNLDRLLSDTPIPKDFDFLVIDIDGNDYHAWKAISEYAPKVVCIEFNPTIPNEVHFVQKPDPTARQGSSLAAIEVLAKSKGYELIAVLLFNAFFVRAEYYPLFQIDDNRPEVMRTDLSAVTYLFSGYDGTLFVSGSGRLPWHGIELREKTLQHLPKFLRKYPPDYSGWERAVFGFITNPKVFLKRLPRQLASYFGGALKRRRPRQAQSPNKM